MKIFNQNTLANSRIETEDLAEDDVVQIYSTPLPTEIQRRPLTEIDGKKWETR